MGTLKIRSLFRGTLLWLTVYAALIILILLAVPGWARHFTTGLPDHWDPCLHAWKLLWNAESICSGRLLPDYNANIFYPHAYTLCFDDLFWIPSLLAALIHLIAANPVLTYNAVSLAFWALSGLLMYWLLRDLELGRTAAFFGAASFCLLPYRTSYYLEFNMQLCFGIPLLLLFLVRYSTKPTLGSALGLAAAFWMQAVSALYYAVIMLFILPLLVLTFWRNWLINLRNRRFWTYSLIGIVLAVGLCALFLYPYHELRELAGYRRIRSEMARHALQPLAYLFRSDNTHSVFDLWWAKPGEMVSFPGFIICLLAAGYAFARRRIFPSRAPGAAPADRGILLAARVARLAAGLTVAGLALQLARWPAATTGEGMAGTGLNAALVVLVACSLAIAAGARDQDRAGRLIAGLGAAAALSFVISIGPHFFNTEREIVSDNAIFTFLYANAPLMQTIRVVSRFSIVGLVLFVAAAARALDLLIKRYPATRWILVPLLAGIFIESRSTEYRFADVSYPEPPILNALKAAEDPTVVAVMPMGNRYHDSRHMLTVGGSEHWLVNGWSGFQPEFTANLIQEFKADTDQRAPELLTRLAPDPYLLVDLATLADGGGGRDRARADGLYPEYELVTRKGDYALYRPRRDLVSTVSEVSDETNAYRRLVRQDFGISHPSVRFEGRSLSSATNRVLLCCNGAVADAASLDRVWRSYELHLPPDLLVRLSFNEISWRSLDRVPWQIRNCRFIASGNREGGSISPIAADLRNRGFGDERIEWSLIENGSFQNPQTEVRAKFEDDIELLGYSLDRTRVQPGQKLKMRYYWRVHPSVDISGLAVFVHFENEGAVFQDDHTFLPHHTVHFQPYPRIFASQREVTIPDNIVRADCQIKVGLWRPKTGDRLNVHAEGEVTDNAFILPQRLSIARKMIDMDGTDLFGHEPLHADAVKESRRRLSRILGGRRAALVWSTNRFGNHEIVLLRLPEFSLQRLTSHPHPDTCPRFSPDGRSVVFARGQKQQVSQRDNRAWDLFIVEVDSGREALLTRNGNAPGWSPDGKKVFFQKNADQVVELDRSTGRRKLLFSRGSGPVPDGVILGTPSVDTQGVRAAVTLRGRERMTAVIEQNRLVRLGGGCQAAWGPGDKYLYLVGDGGRLGNTIYRIDRAGGEWKEWLDLAEPFSHEYFPRVSNDGNYLVLGGSTGGHEHDIADYEIFLWEIGSPPEDAVRVSFNTANDCWPDLYVYPDIIPTEPVP